MIDGVVVTPLDRFLDERGAVLRMLRRDQDVFVDFGEIYFSTVFPGAIKGWHIHSRMVLNYAVPIGQIKFVLYDQRDDSQTKGAVQEIFMGQDNYVLVTVPPLVWNGFKGLGTETSIIANCASIRHDPDEIRRLDPRDPSFPYDWGVKHG